MTDREEAVKPKNPCNKIQVKLVGKTTGHRQEEYSAWISISSVILRTTRIRWRRLSQRMKAFRHWSLRQPLWKRNGVCRRAALLAIQEITNKESSWNHLEVEEYRAQPEYLSWERCPKKSGKYITEIMRIGRDVDWTEWRSWKKSGQ